MATNNSVNEPTAASGTVLQGQGVGTASAFSTATYPSTAGTSGNVITSNGTNFVSQAPAAFSMNIQTFTGSGTYTPTANMKYCIIEALGGGGGGGGALQGVNNGCGAGGGGGEYRRGTFSAATIGVSQAVTVGGGGNGGSAGNNAGSAGTASSVGALISANPGQGGAANNNSSTTSTGGAGGTGGSGGQLNIDGVVGIYGGGQGNTFPGGWGGASFFGGITYKGVSASSGQLGQAGVNAPANKGGGGSGGQAVSGSSVAGGNGGSGIVIVTEFIFA